MDKTTLRRLQVQAWLAQPQGYVVGRGTEHDHPVQDSTLRELGTRVSGGNHQTRAGQGGGVASDGNRKCGSQHIDLLQVGTWANDQQH
jgi:hypothetical protein